MGFPRKKSVDDMYHVVARGTGKQLIFEDSDDYERFLSNMLESSTRFHVEIYAWCLMGNHVHLLLHSPIEQISNFMRILCGSYARYFNNRHGRTGHLFEERFWSDAIDDDSRLLLTLKYIHHNPDKAHISRYDIYGWSSFHEYFGTAKYCSTEFIQSLFDSQEDYCLFHEQDIEDGHSFLPRTRRGCRDADTEEAVIDFANGLLSPATVNDVKTLSRSERDGQLIKLGAAGLSVRQIERLTGISKSVISRVLQAGRKDRV